MGVAECMAGLQPAHQRAIAMLGSMAFIPDTSDS